MTWQVRWHNWVMWQVTWPNFGDLAGDVAYLGSDLTVKPVKIDGFATSAPICT